MQFTRLSPRKNVFIIISAVILILLLIFGLSKTVFPALLPGQQPTPQPSKEKTPDNFQTDDGKQWETYTNDDLQFSVPYPADMDVKASSYGMGVSNIELKAKDAAPGDMPDYQILTFPKTLGSMIGQNFDEYKTMSNNSTKVIKNSQADTSERFTKIKNRTVNGYDAVEFSVTGDPPDPEELPEVGVYIDVGSNVVIISTGEDNRAEFEQMLTNFQYPVK